MNKPKPPLGLTPQYIYELSRIQDITRALYEYSVYEGTIENYELILLMQQWTNELRNRLDLLKENPEISRKNQLIQSR